MNLVKSFNISLSRSCHRVFSSFSSVSFSLCDWLISISVFSSFSASPRNRKSHRHRRRNHLQSHRTIRFLCASSSSFSSFSSTESVIAISIDFSVCVLSHLPRPIFEVELDRHLQTLNSSMTRQAPLLDFCPRKRSFYIGMSNGRRSRIFCTRRVQGRPCR